MAADLHWEVDSDPVTNVARPHARTGRSMQSGVSAAYEAYRQQQIVRFPSRFRKLPILGLLLITGFLVVDATYPWPAYVDLSMRDFIVVRGIWDLGYVLLLATSWWRADSAVLQRVRDYALVVVTAFFLGILCAHTGRLASPYYAGLVLVTIARVTILPGFFWHTMRVLAAMLGTFFVTTWVWPAPLGGVGGTPAVLAIAILVSANGLALVGVWLADRLALGLEAAKIMGRYRLVRRLGIGGMGEVYLAHHASLRRECAVKILKQELCTPDAVARFEREAEAASRLRHPNTIAVFDFGRTDEGQPYYVMEFLDGCDLRQLVQREGPLVPERTEYLLHQAASSLAEAHLLGLIHRDVQPGNLFVTANSGHGDFIKVLDFGLVKGADLGPELTQGETFMGTPRYMAPEALNAKGVDFRADVYALGAVGFYMLCGEAPFASGDAHSDMYRQVHEAAPPVEAKRSSALPAPSRELSAVIARCLENQADARFADASELRAALERTPEHGQWEPARSGETAPAQQQQQA